MGGIAVGPDKTLLRTSVCLALLQAWAGPRPFRAYQSHAPHCGRVGAAPSPTWVGVQRMAILTLELNFPFAICNPGEQKVSACSGC